MGNTHPRTSLWPLPLLMAVPAALVLIGFVALLSRGPETPLPGYAAVPEGGTSADAGALAVNDVWLDAPHGVPVGGTAVLHLDLSDSGQHAARLTDVTGPDFKAADFHLAGHTLESVRVPGRGGDIDLEWGPGSGVGLARFTHRVAPGQYIPVSLHWADGISQRVQVVAGPLGRGTATTPAPRS